MKTIHVILLSCLTLSVGTTVLAGLRKGEDPQLAKPVDKNLLIEARTAVHGQLIDKLPYTIRGNAFSRRAVMPDPYYSAVFSKSENSSKQLGFALMRKGAREKEASQIGTGYYDSGTKLVYLYSAKSKVFVEAKKHPLLLAVNSGKSGHERALVRQSARLIRR